MASVSCSLCAASLGKTDERRRVFSDSSRPVLPLLTDIVTKIYGRDVLRDVCTADGKLCRPCYRRLERIMKLKKELQEKEEELAQQVIRLGEVNSVRVTEPGESVATAELTPQKRPASTVEAEDSPATKRRAMSFQKSTPVRSTLRLMQPGASVDSSHRSPAVAVRDQL